MGSLERLDLFCMELRRVCRLECLALKSRQGIKRHSKMPNGSKNLIDIDITQLIYQLASRHVVPAHAYINRFSRKKLFEIRIVLLQLSSFLIDQSFGKNSHKPSTCMSGK